jgi:hypothetical protein
MLKSIIYNVLRFSDNHWGRSATLIDATLCFRLRIIVMDASSRLRKSVLLDDCENCIFAGKLGAQLVDALGKRSTLGSPHSHLHYVTFF